MKTTVRRFLTGCAVALLTLTCTAVGQQQMPRTTKETITNQSDTKTQVLKGTVLQVEGNKLAVRMSDGTIRTFEPPESRRFNIDGREVSVADLKPGTTLTATVATTTTSLTDRTTTVGSGKVWFVSGNTVILTLPNNENRMYKVAESYRFIVNGEKATVHDLRKGMIVAAEKIVEEPRTEIASNTTVSGHAPPPPAAAPVRTAEAPAPTPTPAPAPHRAAAPAASSAPATERAEAAPLPAKLPKTGSPLPLIGLAGLMLTAASCGLRILRRI